MYTFTNAEGKTTSTILQDHINNCTSAAAVANGWCTSLNNPGMVPSQISVDLSQHNRPLVVTM